MPTNPPTCRFMRAGSGRWRGATATLRSGAAAGLFAAIAIATSAAPQATLPAAHANPAQHTVVYRILGGGDLYSVTPDPGTPVYPTSTTGADDVAVERSGADTLAVERPGADQLLPSGVPQLG
jgi:hypothetical protein